MSNIKRFSEEEKFTYHNDPDGLCPDSYYYVVIYNVPDNLKLPIHQELGFPPYPREWCQRTNDWFVSMSRAIEWAKKTLQGLPYSVQRSS